LWPGLLEKKQAKYLNNISSNTRIIHILVITPTKVKIFPGSEGVKQINVTFFTVSVPA
jgi:hypothetical protein